MVNEDEREAAGLLQAWIGAHRRLGEMLQSLAGYGPVPQQDRVVSAFDLLERLEGEQRFAFNEYRAAMRARLHS